MADLKDNDIVWRTAVDWVIREHEKPLDASARDALVVWLTENPAHKVAYEEASRLWLLTGLVPSSSIDDEEDGSPPQH